MFLQLKHKSLEVYHATRELVKEIYIISKQLPPEKKFNMIPQIRRAALSAKLNLAEGSTIKSGVERKRYMEIARGSVAELDAALETAIDLNYFEINQLKNASELLNKCFAMFTKTIEK